MSNADSTSANPRPCAKCGAVDRGPEGRCRSCKRARNAEWRAANKEKIVAYSAAYYATNAGKMAAYTAAYRAKHPGKAKMNSAAWRAANPEKVRANKAAYHAAHPEARRIHRHNRKARKRENGGVLSQGLSAKLFALQRGKCACCKQPLGDDYEMDHIMPIALGGPNVDSNIQLLCGRCNNKKNAKHPIDFMQSMGKLL
jgi:5-methylcytosine-specific restriction endonuclease McrA